MKGIIMKVIKLQDLSQGGFSEIVEKQFVLFCDLKIAFV
jgi:hypothetical protein